MTSKDFIQAEAENTDRIVLYREGLFWKAYERSAFAVCTQIRPFKPTRRSLKILGGGELISIGFPASSEAEVLAGLQRLETSHDRLVLSTPQPITGPEFEVWKASVPLAQPRSGKADAESSSGSAASHPCGAAPGIGASDAYKGVVTTTYPAPGTLLNPDYTLSTACVIAERVRGYDLASSTPMECMCFLSEMKKLLANPSDYGSIR